MKKNISISAEPESPGGGGGWDEDPRHPSRALQSHGFVALAFGMALGLTLGLFYYLIGNLALELVPKHLKEFFNNNFITFLYIVLTGFIFGTILSAIYNVLLFKHFNLFGDDRKIG